MDRRDVCDVLAPNVVPVWRSASTLRHSTRHPKAEDEAALIADIVELALQYGRYGYRKVAALLRMTAG